VPAHVSGTTALHQQYISTLREASESCFRPTKERTHHFRRSRCEEPTLLLSVESAKNACSGFCLKMPGTLEEGDLFGIMWCLT
jgi:hypothetical protein